MKQKIRWGLLLALSIGAWLGMEIASCNLENGAARCNPLKLETCEP